MDKEAKSPKKKSSRRRQELKERIEDRMKHVHIDIDAPRFTETFGDLEIAASLGIDNQLNMQKFKDNFSINIQSLNKEEIVFDLIGVDAAIANALRRVLIGEVPTMAIEHVFIHNNTSVIQDEVLAHRLGLLPVYADPRMFEYAVKLPPGEQLDTAADPRTTLVFELSVKCERARKKKTTGTVAQQAAAAAATAPAAMINDVVYSSKLVWHPIGDQKERLGSHEPRMVYDDIIVAKMRPGQEIEIEAHCTKGTGREHAKWSPVCTASYRLMPRIELAPELQDKYADELVAMCPTNVFDIEDLGNGHRKAAVARPRNCTMCRECIRHPGWAERVKLKRVKNHFIFSVESSGALPPETLLQEALKILIERCERISQALVEANTIEG